VNAFRLSFQFPPPVVPWPGDKSTTGGKVAVGLALCGQGHVLGEFELPVLATEDFLHNLRLEPVGVLARMGQGLVPCRALVTSQCSGLLACGLLRSPTSLVPLLDLGVAVEFSDVGSGRTQRVPLSLTRSHLSGHSAFLSAAPQGCPGPGEAWTVRWTVAGRCLAEGTIRGLSWPDFWHSLYLIDARYACTRESGPPAFSPYLPAREGLCQVGPCFRLANRKPGAVGFCPMEMHTLFKEPDRPPESLTREVLVTDGPSTFLPPMLQVEEFEQVAAFELLSEGVPLAILPGCRPVVQFTSEGGFAEPSAFDWTTVAEQELVDRLERLEAFPEADAVLGPTPLV
jgi:hypothetical protein